MSKPRVVDVKKPPAKPRIVSQTEPEKEKPFDVAKEAETFSKDVTVASLVAVDEASQELRKQQLRDAIPRQPGISPLNLDPDVMKKIDEDRKKRRGLIGDVKDSLGLK